MSDQLKHFCGVLAVGTHCGHVYLIGKAYINDLIYKASGMFTLWTSLSCMLKAAFYFFSVLKF